MRSGHPVSRLAGASRSKGSVRVVMKRASHLGSGSSAVVFLSLLSLLPSTSPASTSSQPFSFTYSDFDGFVSLVRDQQTGTFFDTDSLDAVAAQRVRWFVLNRRYAEALEIQELIAAGSDRSQVVARNNLAFLYRLTGASSSWRGRSSRRPSYGPPDWTATRARSFGHWATSTSPTPAGVFE